MELVFGGFSFESRPGLEDGSYNFFFQAPDLGAISRQC